MLNGLRNNILANNLKSSLVNYVTVRINMTGHQGLAKTPRGLDHNLRWVPVNRIDRKDNSGAFRVNHFLDTHTDENFLMWKPLLFPVEYGPGSVQAGPTLLNIMD